MDNQQLAENFQIWLAKVINNDRNGVINILNNTGFPTSYSIKDDELIRKTIDGLQLSNTFREDLSSLIVKHCEAEIKSLQSSNKKSFAAQPEQGGMMTILTAHNLTTDIVPTDEIFAHRPLFVENNCTTCKPFNFSGMTNSKEIFKSTDGVFKSFDWTQGIFDTVKLGAGVYSTSVQSEAQKQQAAAAVQLEQLKLKQLQEAADAEAAKSAGKQSVMKGYIPIIAITGAVGILGIAAYFFFKKKKIS
jgi:hypothetical protein